MPNLRNMPNMLDLCQACVRLVSDVPHVCQTCVKRVSNFVSRYIQIKKSQGIDTAYWHQMGEYWRILKRYRVTQAYLMPDTCYMSPKRQLDRCVRW